MIKIPTIFVRDETLRGHPVTPQVKPECQWVLDGEGIATIKLDGTNVKIEGGVLLKRQKPKDRDYDEASYVICDPENPADQWALEAMSHEAVPKDGIYELIGPKVQGNPNEVAMFRPASHRLIRVLPPHSILVLDGNAPERTFDGLRDYLSRYPYEGLVFHHPDGRLAKIKRRDFGLPWPIMS